MGIRRLLALVFVAALSISGVRGGQETAAQRSPAPAAVGPHLISLNQPMPIPGWAFAERALLKSTADAARLWADHYLDANGMLNIVERWGVSDGPDDITEAIRGWPLAYALGAPESVMDLFDRVWEGHLRQFTRAKIPAVEVAKDGIYYKEFPTSYDWEHNGEGLQAFYYYGLGRPTDSVNRARARRFAGFYLNEDKEAPNYDPEHKIIRSLFNGSRGPKLTPATTVDWDGDANPQRAQRFATSSNIRGDHPLNLLSTTLAAQAYLLTHEAKYRTWLLEYVDAWRDRTIANGGNIPSNIGLDGTVGGEWGGKWYGGVFGWNSPDTGLRNYVLRGPPVAFGEALLLTGDQRYVDVLRGQVANLYAAKRVENGVELLPHYYGDKDGKVGWYGYRDGEFFPTGTLGNLSDVVIQLYLWSFKPSDWDRIPPEPPDRRPVKGWVAFLQGHSANYPLEAIQQELQQSARSSQRVRDAARAGYSASPVAFESLVNLTLGGNNLYGSGDVLHSQVRYFDPELRRAGLADGVAALIDTIGPEGITLTLVNTDLIKYRSMIVQMGAYGEHQCVSVTAGSKTTTINAPYFDVRLAPGAGEKLTIAMKRYVNDPTLAFPWDRGWWDNQPVPPARRGGNPSGVGGNSR